MPMAIRSHRVIRSVRGRDWSVAASVVMWCSQGESRRWPGLDSSFVAGIGGKVKRAWKLAAIGRGGGTACPTGDSGI
jgi:hypothetical protein